MARLLNVHRNLVYSQMKAYGIRRAYSRVSDHEIDVILRNYRLFKPDSGRRYVQGYLRSLGLRIQESRVRHSLRRIDGVGQALRNRMAINRREYQVPRPNFLWHWDGNHKLIRWGIPLHGGADGYCRTVSNCLSLLVLAAHSELDVPVIKDGCTSSKYRQSSFYST